VISKQMMLFYAESDGCAVISESVSVCDVTLVISIIAQRPQQQQ